MGCVVIVDSFHVSGEHVCRVSNDPTWDDIFRKDYGRDAQFTEKKRVKRIFDTFFPIYEKELYFGRFYGFF